MEASQGKKAIAKTNWPLGTSMTKRNKTAELFYVLDSTGRGGRARIYRQIAVGGMEVAVEATRDFVEASPRPTASPWITSTPGACCAMCWGFRVGSNE